ncbi:hypothetical protein [Sorangium sp. So ce513]|uniref:hypothetical protein n=1 Tax=Sorangium sp. So ce513 TaxID=3133315 RepID=UPI003F61FEA4
MASTSPGCRSAGSDVFGAYTRFGFGGACGKLQGVEDDVTGAPRNAGSAARDAAEIRGRIAACFSLAELRRFAQELGVPDIPWDQGIKGAAHELVRRFEQRRELWSLVEHLRAVRPLVEWPDLRTVPPASSVGQAHTESVGQAHADIPRPAPLPNLSPAPVAQFPPTLAPPPIPPTTRTPVVPGADVARARAPGAAPAHRPAGAAGAAPARAARRVDSRVLLAALGLVAASLVVAFLIGRASSGSGEEAARAGDGRAAAAPAGAAPPAIRPDGLTARAVAALDRRVESVARACEIAPGAAEDVMRRAFARCGPASVPPAQRAAAQGGPQVAEPETPPAPAAAAGRRAPAAAGNPVAPANAGCVGACERRHKTCRTTRCGREPTQSSQYERYQSCLSTCLEEASKCRLGCL